MGEFSRSLDLLPKNSNKTIILGGDFNLPDINWENSLVLPSVTNKGQCEHFLSSLDEHALTQVQKEQTKDKNILDLCITNKPGLIKSSRSVPGISDDCAVLTEADINPPYRCSTENIRQEIRRHWASFSKDSPNNSVNEKWFRLKSILMDCLNKFVPTKLTSKRRNLPWLNKSLRKAIRKKARISNRAKTSKRPDLWAKYKLQKRDTQRNLRRVRWSFITDKLLTSLETQNSKPFWRYLTSQRQDRCGVSPFDTFASVLLTPADERTRGGHKKSFKHIRANTTLGQNSFLYKTIPDWNHPPPAAIESGSIAAFKSQLSN